MVSRSRLLPKTSKFKTFGSKMSCEEDVVEAPTLWAAFQWVLRDERSEAPDVINAVHRGSALDPSLEATCEALTSTRSSSAACSSAPSPAGSWAIWTPGTSSAAAVTPLGAHHQSPVARCYRAWATWLS